SGCGKSTLLNAAAGLLFPPAGRVMVFGEALRGINQHATYLFQQDALLPWRSVLDNVMLGPIFRNMAPDQARDRARRWTDPAGPARLKGVYDVDLPRPRDVSEIRLNPEFMGLYRKIWADLRDEVKRQYDARQA